MSKTINAPTFKKPKAVEAVLDELTESTEEIPGTQEKKSKKKTERISVIVSPETMEDLNDLLSARIVSNKKVKGAIMGKKSKKPSVNLLVIEALNTFLQSPGVQEELSEFRGAYKNGKI